MTSLRRSLVAATVATLYVAPALGQAVATGHGVVEVLGLREWSIPMLTDSIRKYRPDVTLGDAACADILRDSLGFADAAVLRFRDGRVVLTVIEPAESARVVLRERPLGPEPPAGPWLQFRELQEGAPFALDYAIVTYLRQAAGERIAVEPNDSAVVRSAWAVLARQSDKREWRSAIAALHQSRDPTVRRSAARFLVRYSVYDSTWYGLVQALRDPNWGVRSSAAATLRALREGAARTMDWRPVASDLRHLLAGTTLVFHTELVKLLLATGVAPDLASELLSPGAGRLLVAQANAEHEYVRVPASELLMRLSGVNRTLQPLEWEQWLQRIVSESRKAP